LLRKEGVNFRTTAEFEIVRTIKEKACYLANNPQKEETVETEKYQYTLPDGSTLEVCFVLIFYLLRLGNKEACNEVFSRTAVCHFNPIKPSGNYMFQVSEQSVMLYFVFMGVLWFSL
jgi:hypothetical protein